MCRLDKALFALGITRSRSEAEDLITRGFVSIREADQVGQTGATPKWEVIKKPSKQVPETITREDILINTKQYVSRGAYKLEGAFSKWNCIVQGKNALDIGSSTGGFTEVLLNHGAEKVFAVDVGTNQLDLSLKENPKVVSLEGTNIQTLESLPGNQKVDFFVADVSFVSITQIIPHISRFVTPSAEGVLLIKPQFEVGKEYLTKSGIVKNEKAVDLALREVRTVLMKEGCTIVGKIESPILGGSGNTEYLFYVRRQNGITE